MESQLSALSRGRVLNSHAHTAHHAFHIADRSTKRRGYVLSRHEVPQPCAKVIKC